MKKLLFLFIMMLSPMLASAITTKVLVGNIWYTINDTRNEAWVIANPDGIEKYSGDIIIPATIEYEGVNYPVRAISASAFRECPDLISVSVGGSAISIGQYAFADSPNLTSVVIPDSILSLNDWAFYGCANLEYITPPRYLTKIGYACFGSCSSLKAFPLPTCLESLANMAFNGCESLTSPMFIPEGVTKIGEYTFADCKNIPSVTIPSSVTTINYAAFWGCTNLKDVYCYATTVPVTESDAFYVRKDTYLPQVTLHVPAESIADYEAAIPWNHLGAIVPINADQKESLYGEWWLVGYNDEGNWYEVDTNNVGHRHLSIEIPKEGYVMAYSMVNEIFVGLLTLNGNEMIFGGENRRLSTAVNCAIRESLFFEKHICDIKYYQLEGNLLKLYYTDNDYFVFTSDFNDDEVTEDDYRPFVEDGKIWKVGNTQSILDNVVQVVDYYYFDGDTIVGGKTCKQMMCQRYVSPDHSNEYWTPTPSLSKVGAWYEEDKKVYFYDESKQAMVMKYDFSLAANDTLQFLTDWSSPFIIGPKQTGGIEGFKGVYRDIRMCGDEGKSYHDTFWLEGVGCIRGPISSPCNPILGDPRPEFLMSCTVGDVVIYLIDYYEDGATPEAARKQRIDFTHTIKIKPQSRTTRGAEASLYGEYNEQQLGINLNTLDDAYQVSITDEAGKAVYEKTVNAGNIVGLNINISDYAEGRYTVTVENSNESFTAQFDTQTTSISLTPALSHREGAIYNLQGQRISTLQKGVNIVNGRKVFVK